MQLHKSENDVSNLVITTYQQYPLLKSQQNNFVIPLISYNKLMFHHLSHLLFIYCTTAILIIQLMMSHCKVMWTRIITKEHIATHTNLNFKFYTPVITLLKVVQSVLTVKLEPSVLFLIFTVSMI